MDGRDGESAALTSGVTYAEKGEITMKAFLRI